MTELALLKSAVRLIAALLSKSPLVPAGGFPDRRDGPHYHAEVVIECVQNWRFGRTDRDYLGHALVHLLALVDGDAGHRYERGRAN